MGPGDLTTHTHDQSLQVREHPLARRTVFAAFHAWKLILPSEMFEPANRHQMLAYGMFVQSPLSLSRWGIQSSRVLSCPLQRSLILLTNSFSSSSDFRCQCPWKYWCPLDLNLGPTRENLLIRSATSKRAKRLILDSLINERRG